MNSNQHRFLKSIVALGVGICGVGAGRAGVLYSETFESYGVDSLVVPSAGNITGSGFITARANANETNGAGMAGVLPVTGDGLEHKFQIRSSASLANADGLGNGSPLPEAGLTAANANWSGNKFLEFHDGSSNVGPIVNLTARLSSPIPTTGSVYTFSFDFYEPAGYTAGPNSGGVSGDGNGIAIIMGNAGNPPTLNTTALGSRSSRFTNVIIGDGVVGVDPTPDDSYVLLNSAVPPTMLNQSALDNLALETKHSMMLVGNFNTGITQNYTDAHGNARMVDSNRYDVYLDGVLVATGVGYRPNSADPNVTSITDIGFVFTTSGSVGVMYFDNILVRDDFQAVHPAVPGDFDGNGDVDGADFVAWQTNFPTTSGAILAQGDADGDGDVDGADFVVWQTNFPFVSGGISTIPEPGTMFLIIFGVMWLVIFRSTKKLRRGALRT